MKNRTYSVLALSIAGVLAGAALVARGGPPVVGTAVGAAGNLGLGAGNPGGGFGGAGGFNTTARGAIAPQGTGSFSTGNGFGSSLGSVETIGMRQERAQAQIDADSHASVMAQARGQTVAKLAAGGASASLNTAETVHTIQAQAMAKREELLDELHLRVDASAKAMADTRKSGAKLDGEAKANFAAASDDVKAKEKALHKSMKAAEKADADAWVNARAKLATDFDAYASAVAHAEAVSHAESKSAGKPSGEKPQR